MKRLVVFALCLLVCALAAPAAKAADAAKVTCTAGADCDAKWRRALRWVMDNSVFPITEQTDTTISTETRLPFGDTDLIFTISKNPQGYGRNNVFQFDFKAGCGTFFSGCRPTIQEAEAAFARYVAGGAALPGAIVEAPGAAAPAAPAGVPVPGGPSGTKTTLLTPAAPGAAAVAADGGSKLVCKGGGAMSVHFDYQKNTGTGRPDQVVFELSFDRAPTQTPGPGQCALSDRPLRANEPAKITMSGAADRIGFELTLTAADKKLSNIAVKGTGGLHDGVANFLDAALAGKDFTAEVTNISNQQWEVTGQYAY